MAAQTRLDRSIAVLAARAGALSCLVIAGAACSDEQDPIATAGAPAPAGGGMSATNGGSGASGSGDMPLSGNGGGSAAGSAAPAGGASGGGGSAGGSGGAGAGTGAADAGAIPGDGGEMDDDAAVTPGEPTLPPIDDPGEAGPFGSDRVTTAPGLSTHTLFVPAELGTGGVKHPVVVWTNGATGTTSFYLAFLQHLASHGFFVVADKMSGSNHDLEIEQQKAGIDWVIAEAARADSPYAGKIDVERLAIMGHSLGSIASFANGGDPRLKTTIHWSGGLVGNPVGADEAWIDTLHVPAAFLCGGADTSAGPACANDFEAAPTGIGVFYGTLAGVSHLGVFGNTRGGEYGRAGVAWLRWHLADDVSFKSWFTGASCEFCTSPWTGMSRDL